jgi:nucleoside-diphosphate-sugar epimerase
MNSSPERVLITGGSGFVSFWMERTKPTNIQTWLSDSIDYANGTWERNACGWDAIVHLAPVSPARVLRYAQEHKVRVLFASSGAVYEQQTEYANNKRKWEQECLDSGADVVIARLFSFIGPHLNRHAVHEFIEQGKTGGPIVITNPDAIRTYLYGEDLGRWMWKLLLEGEGIYDVGGSTEYTMLQVAETVADICHCEVVDVHAMRDTPTRYVPDISRACALGCEETVGLREAIERIINAGY